MVGQIVEAEAYLAHNDAACHGARPPNERTRGLWREAGRAYIYHLRQYALLDVTTESADIPSAVLLRAIEPVQGEELMRAHRGGFAGPAWQLANGPGKLCAALAIDRSLDGVCLAGPSAPDAGQGALPLYLAHGKPHGLVVARSTRVGITQAADLPLRFFVLGSQFVSRGRMRQQ